MCFKRPRAVLAIRQNRRHTHKYAVLSISRERRIPIAARTKFIGKPIRRASKTPRARVNFFTLNNINIVVGSRAKGGRARAGVSRNKREDVCFVVFVSTEPRFSVIALGGRERRKNER